jgi:gliding motility-associated-like protein
MFVVKDTISGCFNDTTVNIKDLRLYPPVDAGEPQFIDCIHDTVTLNEGATNDLPNIIFDWNGPVGGILSPDSLISILAGSGGQYYLTAYDTILGCENTDSVMVVDMSQLPEADIDVLQQITCSDSTAMLDIGSSETGSDIHYEWNGPSINGVTSTVIEPTEPGYYYLTVSNQATGCIADDSVLLVLPQLPQAVDAEMIAPLCEGDASGSLVVQEVIGGTPPFSYSLNDGPHQNSPIFDDLLAGNYTLEVIDANGCSYQQTFIIPEGTLLTIDIGPDIQLSLGDSIQLEAIVNLPWNLVDSLVWTPIDQLSCTHCIDPILTALLNEIITATVYAGGCIAEDQLSLHVDLDVDVYIPNVFSPNGDDQNDKIIVFADDRVRRVLYLEIFDRWGNMVFKATDFPPNDPGFGWDGTFRNIPMNPAVFAYVAKVELINGAQIPYKGDITLIR